MTEADETEASVCVIGRSRFDTGIGAVSYAACELLSRAYPVSIFPTDQPNIEGRITLPNGREVPVCRDLDRPTVFFFTDVLWNGAADFNYRRVPNHGLRIAHIAYDSDRLPSKWADILNDHFDIALFSSRHLEHVARSSGVRIAIGTLPIGLDLKPDPTRRIGEPESRTVRIGALAAFHERKGHDLLLEAFASVLGNNPGAELVIHSNLAFGTTYERLAQTVADLGLHNVRLSNSDLSKAETMQLLASCDVVTSCSRGEGYSIGLREALAHGKVLAASDIGAHQDLFGPPGVFPIPLSGQVPARYPEIDNLVVGLQADLRVEDVASVLLDAVQFVRTRQCDETASLRTQRAMDFSFERLATDYSAVIDPAVRGFRRRDVGSAFTALPEVVQSQAKQLVGPYLSSLGSPTRVLVPAHDGGFFSVFNTFLSHLTWSVRDRDVHMVLPDWDVSRLLERISPKGILSFCYGQPDEGNLWLRFFEPLFGLEDADMNSEQFLYENSRIPVDHFNHWREPLLTHINAYHLYRHPDFYRIRRQYHAVISDHLRLRPHLQSRVDEFCEAKFQDKLMIAAHVKHPSHVIEQPDAAMANARTYIDRVYAALERHGTSRSDGGWGVFLATDQDRVVNLFQDEFGERLAWYPDVRRTTAAEDEAFESLSPEEQAQEGHQVQHLVATNPSSWSTRMADEVIIDMLTMSRCHTLLHVVSNVSTAAAFFNPELELEFTS